jgi:hypothetical protein
MTTRYYIENTLTAIILTIDYGIKFEIIDEDGDIADFEDCYAAQEEDELESWGDVIEIMKCNCKIYVKQESEHLLQDFMKVKEEMHD